uniref:Tyrosine-protein kinase Srms n=2 Tax=Tetraselmis sp. GSL018 TaxID=582737 RepID=A0A061RSS9_9CHLO
MAGALRDNRSLVVLNLEGNLIGSPGATALARVLRHDGALVELYLEGNFIGDEGATLLVEALTQNPALKELGLDCNNVSEDVMRELEERVAALHGGPSDLQKDGPSRINKILFSELQMQQEPDLRISNYITVQQATWHGQKVAAVTIQRNEADSYPVALERLGQHPRIAKLHGISEVHEERRVLVTEFSPEGSLDEVLQNLKGQARTISIMVVLQCAIQVCEGMLHVVTDDFVCFDLALRNVLVFGFDPKNHNALRLKLAYYGLICGHLGKNGSKENASICLIAPETRRWSEKSAVWAFGMLLWQLWSARELLYMPGSEIEVAQILLRGECLEKPKKCPDSVFSVMEWCWKKQPSERLSFQELKSELLHVIATFEAAKVEEIPYQDLHMGKALGIGSGKTVRQATWRGQNVAVLTLHTKEASIELTAFERLGRHPRLIQLIGISWDSEGNCLLVTELAPLGSLDKVLGDLEEEGSAASNLVLVKCAMQVCEGMEQIAEEGLVHRRLGLRNVMVFGFNPVIQNAVYLKISDYGLSRDDLCFYDGWEDMPIRWMAPESVKKRQWSEKSDVWAFGVLMWELWSMAEIPYALNSNKEVAQLVSRGEHPAKPPTCPDRIYALMKQCWEIQTAQRPTFQELRVELLDLYSAMASSSSNLHIT